MKVSVISALIIPSLTIATVLIWLVVYFNKKDDVVFLSYFSIYTPILFSILVVVYNIYISLFLIKYLKKVKKHILCALDIESDRDAIPSSFIVELDELADSVNQLTKLLWKYKAQVDEEKKSLRLVTNSIIESAFDAIIGINEEGKVIIWNHTAEGMFGYLKSEAIGNFLEDLIIPEDLRGKHRTRLNEFYARSSTKRRKDKVHFVIQNSHLQAMRKDGTLIPVEIVVIQTIREMNLVAFIRDISDKLALEKRTERYMSILEQKVLERTRELQETQQQLEHVNTLLKNSQRIAISSMNIAANRNGKG